MRRFRRDRAGMAALACIVVLILLAVFAPWLAPGDPADNDLSQAMATPGPGLWLGADDQGRDLVTRVLYGLRLTLVVGAASVGLGGFAGILLGLVAAFYRRADMLVMRCMDVLLSFPAILFGLAVAAILGPGVAAVVLALSVASVPLFARITRAAATVEMHVGYIEASRAAGTGDARLIGRHLLPNCASALLVFTTLRFGQVILLGATLSFLGLGAQPPAAELGAMASAGRNFLFFAPHIAIVPCVAILILVLACNVLGDSLRDALDPRSYGAS